MSRATAPLPGRTRSANGISKPTAKLTELLWQQKIVTNAKANSTKVQAKAPSTTLQDIVANLRAVNENPLPNSVKARSVPKPIAIVPSKQMFPGNPTIDTSETPAPPTPRVSPSSSSPTARKKRSRSSSPPAQQSSPTAQRSPNTAKRLPSSDSKRSPNAGKTSPSAKHSPGSGKSSLKRKHSFKNLTSKRSPKQRVETASSDRPAPSQSLSVAPTPCPVTPANAAVAKQVFDVLTAGFAQAGIAFEEGPEPVSIHEYMLVQVTKKKLKKAIRFEFFPKCKCPGLAELDNIVSHLLGHKGQLTSVTMRDLFHATIKKEYRNVSFIFKQSFKRGFRKYGLFLLALDIAQLEDFLDPKNRQTSIVKICHDTRKFNPTESDIEWYATECWGEAEAELLQAVRTGQFPQSETDAELSDSESDDLAVINKKRTLNVPTGSHAKRLHVSVAGKAVGVETMEQPVEEEEFDSAVEDVVDETLDEVVDEVLVREGAYIHGKERKSIEDNEGEGEAEEEDVEEEDMEEEDESANDDADEESGEDSGEQEY